MNDLTPEAQAFDDDHPEPDPIEQGKLEIWWSAGGHAPWRRVWREGIDVTDEDPSTWPAIWQPRMLGRSRSGRKGWHTPNRGTLTT